VWKSTHTCSVALGADNSYQALCARHPFLIDAGGAAAHALSGTGINAVQCLAKQQALLTVVDEVNFFGIGWEGGDALGGRVFEEE
jgi:hypothetical protein